MAGAKMTVLNYTKTDEENFKIRLATYCNAYVMEVAKPIMESWAALYEDDAIVRLVDLWFEADAQYEHRRRSYLVQWANYDPSDEYGIEPLDSYKWEDDKRKAYKTALDALLVR